MGSWVRFLGLHLGTGPRDYLSSDTLKRLHTANPKSKYAFGWLSPVPGVLTHAGSNEMNYAEVILLQRKKMGFIIATNSGPTKVVSRAINRAFPSLIRRYLKRKRRPKKTVPPTP